MRIVIIGATGNVGTAVLRRLQAAPEATQLVGIARRVPDVAAEPYAGVDWVGLDLTADSATAELTDILSGADAVVHLAWALQPNHDEAAMRKTNVGGTARVLAAVAAAGVPHLVIASSVGAYSVGPKRRRVDESWPTGGVPRSHYARHKAVNERALDVFESDNPGVIVTRLRPGLIFQRDAGAEIAGLFLGQLFPTSLMKLVRFAVLPLPSGAIVQAVHANDVADAVWRIIDRRAGGAFNLAAEPVLDPEAIAAALGARGTVPLRGRVARLIVELTWRARLQATDAGWVDIALAVPLMSTERARRELGWNPEVSATDALAEVADAMARRSNVPGSGPLHG